MIRLLILVALLLAAPARAADWSSPSDWPTADKALAGVAIAATVADWAQSRYIAQNPGRLYEINPILGRHPTVGAVNTYFAGALVGGVVLALVLPERQRRWFLGGAATLEVIVVGRNAGLGIRMSF